MSEYSALDPLHGHSLMHITLDRYSNEIHFLHSITYEYLDHGDPNQNYRNFLSIPSNMDTEIMLNHANMQAFLDEEQNLINGNRLDLNVLQVNIGFHDPSHPFTQWLVEFKGELVLGTNIYENIIDPETLTYPIDSVYVFDARLEVVDINSHLLSEISSNRRVIEYHGNVGKKVGPREILRFKKSF